MANSDISVKPAGEPGFSIGGDPGLKSDISIKNSTSSAAPVSPAATPKDDPPKGDPVYGPIPAVPTMPAVEGITFDFNDGIRILFPHNGKTYRVCFSDVDTGIILYNADTVEGAFVTSVKKFFIRFKLQIFRPKEAKPIFEHVFNPRGRDIMIQLPVSTIGDAIGWFSYVERFQQKHKCRVICVMLPHISALVRDQYPEVTFVSKEDTAKYKPYACYYMGLFFKGNVDNQPIDFRYIGLHRTAGYILGVDPSDIPPRFNLSAKRRIAEPYVCIAAQSSSQAKYWNNPHGWLDVIDFLKKKGYRVICIDRDMVYGQGIHQNFIPYGCENETGARPLQERVDLVKDADFFIGLSSGLSWLAWGCGVPVVMISGFTHPTNEFSTPYRVINYHTCHSCWNDMRVDFDHYDFLWCPRLKDTPRQFECTRLISSEQVIKTIKRIPAYLERHPEDAVKDGE